MKKRILILHHYTKNKKYKGTNFRTDIIRQICNDQSEFLRMSNNHADTEDAHYEFSGGHPDCLRGYYFNEIYLSLPYLNELQDEFGYLQTRLMDIIGRGHRWNMMGGEEKDKIWVFNGEEGEYELLHKLCQSTKME